ncbi:MAG: hypothetical protein ACI89L_002114 [Phycisphaerales bacterium]
MNRNTGWILSTAVAASGPLAVIMVRMIGAGAGVASANLPVADEAVPHEDLRGLVLPTDQLRDAWAKSEAVWARVGFAPPIEGDAGSILMPDVPGGGVILPRYVLSAVLGGSARGAAVLDEQIYWVGEDLGHGWRLDRVDHQSRTVTLRHESGQDHRIAFAEGD